MQKPTAPEYAPYYENYISKVEADPYELLVQQTDQLSSWIEENEDKIDYAYADGKWTVRQLVMHIMDTEQIFAYRLLRIARGDTGTPLPGFDQDVFIENTDFSHLDAGDLIRMVESQRAHTFALLNTVTTDKMDNTGIASGSPISVRALIYIMAGHAEHHLQILNERYL